MKAKLETRTFRPNDKSERIIQEAKIEGLKISTMINALIVKHGQKWIDQQKVWR